MFLVLPVNDPGRKHCKVEDGYIVLLSKANLVMAA